MIKPRRFVNTGNSWRSPPISRVNLVAVIITRFPGTIMSALQGSQAQKGNYYLTVVLWAFSLGMAAWLYEHRENLYQWIRGWHREEE